MILLEEAVERYALAASDYGIQVSRVKRKRHVAKQILEVEKRLGGLRLPSELRYLWTTWTPESFGSLIFDGLYRLDEVKGVYSRDTALGYPRACVPLVYLEKAGVWVELETPEHPGGRIYHTYYDKAELQLWCVGISDLFHLVSSTIESEAVNEPASPKPWLDHAVFESIRLEQTSDLLAMPDEWRVKIGDRANWPDHWKAAERPVEVGRDSSAPTHSLAEFEQAREQGRIEGTLLGEVVDVEAGGPVDGTVVTLSDGTGSIQVYASVEVQSAFNGLELGSERLMDVIGEPSARGFRPSRDSRNFMLRRSFEEFSAGQLRLLEQMRRVELSVAVTAVRERAR